MNLLHRAGEVLSRIVTGETPNIAEIEALLNEIETSKASDEQVRIAKSLFEDDDTNVDHGAFLSQGDDGYWVSAWVFIGNPDSDEDEGEGEDEDITDD
jgi:hypothetical protein